MEPVLNGCWTCAAFDGQDPSLLLNMLYAPVSVLTKCRSLSCSAALGQRACKEGGCAEAVLAHVCGHQRLPDGHVSRRGARIPGGGRGHRRCVAHISGFEGNPAQRIGYRSAQGASKPRPPARRKTQLLETRQQYKISCGATSVPTDIVP